MSTININVSKTDMGLDQVDNTSDLNKPISTATQTALDNIDLQSVTDLGNTTTDNIAFTGAVGVLFDNTSTLRKGTIDAGYGGAKGIAQVCAVGYELKWEAGRLYVMGDGGTTIREVSHNFTTTPSATDDNTKGFIVGSRWILDNGDLYVCTDVTTATAVWVLQTIDASPTDGSTKAVSSNGVFDALADKVDKVVGSRLITSAESTLIGNTSGVNTGDETVTTIKSKLGVTTLSGSNTGDQDLSGYQLTSGKDASSGYVGISAGNVITLPLGRGFISNNVTPNQIAYFDNSGNLLTLSVATYPSITELSYVKGVTSAIQTQINTKAGQDARVQTVTSSATVTPVSTNDLVIITAQATGLTLANPTGTFTEGQALMIRIKDNGTARTIAFDTNYRAIGVTLPTTTVISKTLYLGIIYNATDGKWDIVGYNLQA